MKSILVLSLIISFFSSFSSHAYDCYSPYKYQFNPYTSKKNSMFLNAAKGRIGVTTSYNAFSDANGNVPNNSGVCTDLILRSFAAIGMGNPFAHLSTPRLVVSQKEAMRQLTHLFDEIPESYPTLHPGDILTWVYPGGQNHIGIVSDIVDRNGYPKIVHNFDRGVQEERFLSYSDVPCPNGHFRMK